MAKEKVKFVHPGLAKAQIVTEEKIKINKQPEHRFKPKK